MGLQNTLFHLLLAVPLGLAHPPGMPEPLHAAQPLYLRSLDHCQEEFNAPEVKKRMVDRHMAEFNLLRKKRGLDEVTTIKRRQTPAKALATSHKSSKTFTMDADPADLFSDAGACMMAPEVTEGPLYVRGEQIRRDVTQGEGGVKMRLMMQVVDAKTCKPVTDAWVDYWSCNSTGIYGGVLNYPGNGNPNDLSLINVTTHRGVQPTDEDGIAIFDAVVPGHYSGRATHSHAMVHHGVTKQANGTITGGRVSHVGQMYFDMSLLQEIEASAPYNTNKQQWVQNSADFLFRQGATGDDPIVNYVPVAGPTYAQGLFAWIRVGIDAAATRRYNPAAYVDEKGGHQLSGGGMGGMGGGFGFPMPGAGAPGAGAGGRP